MKLTTLVVLLAAMLAAPVSGQTCDEMTPQAIKAESRQLVAVRGGTRLNLAALEAHRVSLFTRRQTEPHERNWIARHPVLFGALVGFGGGFLIGYLPGDDGVFDDFTAEFSGLVLGGAGAGAGAVVGAIYGR